VQALCLKKFGPEEMVKQFDANLDEDCAQKQAGGRGGSRRCCRGLERIDGEAIRPREVD
jgi:hypothetical protein